MKNIILSLITLISSFLAMSCWVDNKESAIVENNTNTIEVYYFHYTHRCATCTAVEKVTEDALNELYPEEIKSGKIIFLSINTEEESNKDFIDKYEVSGQTLLITKGSAKKNLTNEAFMNARSNPNKLKEAIKKTVDEFLK